MDEIRQKIEEFKKDLQSQSPLKEILLTCPAVLPAIGLIIGLAVQYYFNLPLFIWFGILVLSTFLYLPLFCSKTVISTEVSPDSSGRTKRRNLFFYRFLDPFDFAQGRLGIFDAFARNDNREFLQIIISILLCFACLGSIRLLNFNCPAANDIRSITGSEFTFAHIKAQIISKPAIIDNNDWYFAKYFHSLPYTAFYAKVTDIKTASGWTPASGTIKFYISEDVNTLHIGDKFETFCGLNKFSGTDNPGQFDTARYMNSNGVYLSASVKSANSITIFEKGKLKSPFDIKMKLHDLAVTALQGDTEPDNDMRLVEAMVLGSRTKINKKLYNDFIKTGLVHLVVLSGLNVGIFAGCFWWLSRKAGLLHQGRSIACIIATIVFLLVVPAQSSTLRAGIMFFVLCLARFFDQRSSLLNSIALSAILLLLINPMDFLSPGFQLSFAATVGIVLFCPIFFNFLITPFGSMTKNYIYKFIIMLLAAFSTGCTAWLFITPITVWHFYQVQLLTALWTVPAMIPATVIIVLGTFKILLNPLLPTLAYGLGFIIDFSAKILSELVTLFAKVPFSNVTIGKLSIYLVLLFYLMLFLWKFFPFRKPARNFIYPAAILLLLISAVSVKYFKNLNNLKLTVLSVSHGQAVHIGLPDGKNIIIDAGSMSKSDIGSKIINSYFNYAAVDEIDSVFISHDDIDHYNGLPEIFDKHKCENIYTTLQFIQSAATSAADADLTRFISSKGLSLEISPEKILMDKVAITCLWPKEMTAVPDFTDNQASLVLLLEYAGRKIMFCSDMTKDVQNQFINLYPALDIDIMVVPHHGSALTLSLPFLNTLRPEFFITSCAQSQFGRISPQVLNSQNSFYTCRDGATSVLIDSAGRIKLSTFK